MLVFKSKKVLGYNIISNLLSVTEANFANSSVDMFLNFSRSININGILYVNGGWNDTTKSALRSHLSFDLSTKKVIDENDMIYGHSAHSLLFVPPNYLYCISGSGI